MALFARLSGRRWRGAGAARPLNAALAAAVLTSVLMPTYPAGAATTVTPLPANSVNVVQGADVSLTQPADGRLRGNGLQAVVTGYAFKRHASPGIGLARGQEQLEFALSDAFLGQTTIPLTTGPLAGAHIDPANGALDIDGQLVSLPAPQTDDGSSPIYYLASVPLAAHDVALQLTQDGFTQTFSFTNGAREGIQPPVLYRDPQICQPYENLGETQTVPTPDPQDNLLDASLPIKIDDVYLTWYAPQSANTHPALNQAYLTFDGTAQAGGTDNATLPGTYLNYLNPLTAAQVTLTLPEGQTLTSTLAPDKKVDETGAGLFSGDYFFTVPWDLTKATLNITIANLQVQNSYLPQGTNTLTVGKTVSFPIDLPAHTAPPSSPGPNNQTAPSAVPTAARPHHSSGSPWLLIVLLFALVAVVGAAARVISRRRRSSPHPTDTPAASCTSPDPAAAAPPTIPTSPIPSPATRTLGLCLEAPPPPAGTPEVQILGPDQIAGWPADTPPAGPILELATFLACNPDRGYTAEELRDHLSSDPDQPLSRDSIRTYAGTLRRQLGSDYFPDGGRAGYRLVSVTTDWHRFQDLLRAADSSSEDAETAQHLASALALVRGEPLPAGTNGAFRWADHDLRSSIEVTIADTAIRLAKLAQAHGDHQLAAWAATHGLLAEKHSNRLNALALTTAHTSGDPDRLAQAWREVTRRFSPDPVPDNLVTLYESLRSNRPRARTGIAHGLRRPQRCSPE